MPKIVQFQAPDLGLRPSETGAEAFAAAGRRLGGFYNQVGQATERFGEQAGRELGGAIRDAGQVAVDYLQHREISHGAATFAQLTSDLTDQWNAAAKNADPNDPSVAAKFRETALEPTLDKFREAFNTEGGQKWAESHIDALRTHMFEKTSADMATLAGQAARVNATNAVNTLSNTVFNDPSALPFSLKTLDTSVAGIVDSSPNLKGAAAGALKAEISEKAREQIVKSAAIGYIEKTATVPPWVTDPAYSKYVNGIELKQFQKAAEAQRKANDYYDSHKLTLEKQKADLQVHQDAGALMADFVRVDPNSPNKLLIDPQFMQRTLDIVRKNPNAPSAAATARTMIDWAESQSRVRNEVVSTDQTVKADLLTRMSDPNHPTTEMQILDWAARDKLSPHDTTILREMVKSGGPELMRDPLVHAAIQGASERVGVGLMNNGHERYSNFFQQFYPEYLKQKRDGTLPNNALDLNDEKSLIRQSLKTWEPTPQDRLRAEVMKRMQSVGNTESAPAEPKAAPALPPKDKLEDGKFYDTALGRLKWDAKRGMFVTP